MLDASGDQAVGVPRQLDDRGVRVRKSFCRVFVSTSKDVVKVYSVTVKWQR